MKIILIQDKIDKGYTGFLDDHPTLIIQVDELKDVENKMKEVIQIFIDCSIQDKDINLSKVLMDLKNIEKFELVVYTLEDQYNLLKNKLK